MKLFKRPTKTANGLPIDFTEVEYIENTSTSTSTASYIDTGVEAVPGTSLMVSFSFNSTTVGQAMGQGYLAGSRFTVVGLDTGQANFSYAYNNWYRTTTPVDTNRHTFELDTYNKTYRIDNTVTNLASVTYTSEGFTIGLFARFCNASGTKLVNWNAAGKLYHAVIKVNNVLVRDMIPCLDASNVPCMYDKVEGKPYYNAGSGTFSYGRKIIPVEYLESNGTQYIDTGVILANPLKVDMELAMLHPVNSGTADSNYPVMFGANDGDTRRNIFIRNNYGDYQSDTDCRVEADIGNTYNRKDINYGKRFKFYYDQSVSTDNTIIDDTTYTYPVGDWNVSCSLYLFAQNNNGTLFRRGVGRVYRCKLWISNVLVRDYTPVKDENGVGYMLDTISHTLYANNGTGTFTYGSETYSEPHPCFVKTVNKDIYNGLPVGFTEVEYLKSNYITEIGTWIDTGYYPNNETKVEIQISDISAQTFSPSSGGTWFLGGRQAYLQKMFGSYYNPSEQKLYFGFSTAMNSASYSTTNMYGNNKILTLDKSGLYVNGTKVVNNTTATAFTSPATLILFGLNNNGTAVSPTIDKIHYCKIWDNNILVRDYIPALDRDGVPCMYDRVTKTPFYNAGTGELTYGPKIIPVEYIESSGTQYINTSVIAKSGLSSLLDFEYTALDTTSISMLDARSSDNRFYLCHTGNANGYWFYYGYGSAVQSSVTPTVNTRYKVETTLKSGTQLMKVNGTTILSGTSATTYNLNTSLYLFGINYNTPQFLAKAKLYACKIYNNDTLIRDMIPIKDENDVGYMFDRVTHTLYGNAGTGVFTYGNTVKMITTRALAENINVLPKLYQQVNWLKASAQQYIDTGIYGKTGIRANVGFEWDATDIGKDRYILGASTGSTRVYFGTYQSKWMYGYGNYQNVGTPLADTYYDAEVSWEKGNQYVKINGTTEITGTSTDIIGIQNNMILFARNQDSPNYYSAAKIYYCKMWEDGKLIRWYIPVIRKSDSKPGMYDVINQNFCVNNRAGVADFTYG